MTKNDDVKIRTGQQTINNSLREKNDFLVWTCYPCGSPAHTTASTILAGSRIQERTKSTKPKREMEGVQSTDLQQMRFTREEAEVTAVNRHGWS